MIVVARAAFQSANQSRSWHRSLWLAGFSVSRSFGDVQVYQELQLGSVRTSQGPHEVKICFT